MNVVQQMSAQMDQMAQIIAAMRGDAIAPAQPAPGGGASGSAPAPAGNGTAARLTREMMKANTPMTDYGQRLARQSKPTVMGE